MDLFLQPRIALLESAQNPDGGWGYFPGKSSWLEPTVYAVRALRGRSSPTVTQAGFEFVRGLQLPCGAWAPSASVREPHWTTSISLGLHAALGVHDERVARGLSWLLAEKGSESDLSFRIGQWLHPGVVEFDARLNGWPWWPGTSSWVEPTAHALMALKRGAPLRMQADVQRRVSLGERMLVDRRCRDGGWNHGDRRVLGVDQPSYPESTAIALLALRDNRFWDPSASVQGAEHFLREAKSPLARAWLRISLQAYGSALPGPDCGLSRDNLVTALEVIGCSRWIA